MNTASAQLHPAPHSESQGRQSFQAAVDAVQQLMSDMEAAAARPEAHGAACDGSALTDAARDGLFQGKEASTLARRLLELDALDAEEKAARVGYARERILPFLLQSPFVERAWAKPLGYAGDYEMVNHILGGSDLGDTVFAKTVSAVSLRAPVAQAHRNRVDLLESFLVDKAERAALSGRSQRVLNLGCGPAVEVQRFLRSHPNPSALTFVLVDFNEETLDWTRAALERVMAETGRRTDIEYVLASVTELASKKRPVFGDSFDAAYCAGLFDYLTDRMCRRVVEFAQRSLKAGGASLFTNVHSRARSDAYGLLLEHVVDWPLIHRDEAQMLAIMPQGAKPKAYCDATGLNIFVEQAVRGAGL